MGDEIDFVSVLHTRTARDYVGRVTEHDKAECAAVAKQWGKDYWDGERQFGYGGMRYDGRWRVVAEAIAKHYDLKPDHRVLDVGCGKGYLLYELTQVVPGLEVAGLDISTYGIENAKPEISAYLSVGDAVKLPWADNCFDLVLSITTLHNLYNFELHQALGEIERVGRGKSWLCTESYRNEREKANLLYWQLTCESFFTPDEWRWAMAQAGYTGDYGFIYFG